MNRSVPHSLCPDDFLEESDEDVPEPVRLARQLRQQQTWNLIALGLSTLVLVLAALLQVLPEGRVGFRAWPAAILPESCMTKVATGLPCPGCGLTRSFIHLTHGDLESAFAVNRSGVLLYALLLLQFPYRLWLLFELGQGIANTRTWPSVLAVIAAASVLVNWLIG